ncbi:MAG TPA: hypothetical protein VEC75_12155, partial [Stellaceae bacterium]|nr:hypothetical protein [Stellaceae bacterium]
MMRKYLAGLVYLALIGLVALPTAALAQQKTSKECNDEYAANKDAIKASGKKKSDFIKECRAGTSTATTGQTGTSTTTPSTSTSTTTKTTATPPATKTTGTPPAPAPQTASAPKTNPSTTTLAAGQYASESQAKSHCPGDTVVWANTSSKIYHYSTSKDYGN